VTDWFTASEATLEHGNFLRATNGHVPWNALGQAAGELLR